MDDGSIDESVATLQKIRDTRVRTLFAKQQRGLAASLNQITKLANGKYIARMDADDLMHPERLERQIQLLEARPELDGVGCGLIVLDRAQVPIGSRVLPAEHEEICNSPLEGFRIAHATFVGRADWFRAHAYNEANHGCEDWELWVSSFRTSRFANLPDLLYFYREFDSFALNKYVRKKADFAARLLSKGREFGTMRALVASAKQYAHIALYAGAARMGQTDRLLRRRNDPLEEPEVDDALETLRTIQGTVLPDLDESPVMDE